MNAKINAAPVQLKVKTSPAVAIPHDELFAREQETTSIWLPEGGFRRGSVLLDVESWQDLFPESAQDTYGSDEAQRRSHQSSFRPFDPVLPCSEDDGRQTQQRCFHQESDSHECGYSHFRATLAGSVARTLMFLGSRRGVGSTSRFLRWTRACSAHDRQRRDDAQGGADQRAFRPSEPSLPRPQDDHCHEHNGNLHRQFDLHGLD